MWAHTQVLITYLCTHIHLLIPAVGKESTCLNLAAVFGKIRRNRHGSAWKRVACHPAHAMDQHIVIVVCTLHRQIFNCNVPCSNLQKRCCSCCRESWRESRSVCDSLHHNQAGAMTSSYCCGWQWTTMMMAATWHCPCIHHVHLADRPWLCGLSKI